MARGLVRALGARPRPFSDPARAPLPAARSNPIRLIDHPGKLAVNAINLAQKLSLFSDHWHPRIVGELNGQHVKLAKLQGEFVWHDHADEDELFLVLKGRLRMEFRDHTVELGEGEILIVPRGVEHRPIADDEVHVLLFEPASTKHTGDVEHALTRHELERI
jgi:mannose-6-phosphate isomerase-like protein (cupin superfamily)